MSDGPEEVGKVVGRVVGSIGTAEPEEQKPWDDEMTVRGLVARMANNAGMSPRELTTQGDKIPAFIRKALDPKFIQAPIQSVLLGERPEHGFGISGPAGIGKTFALCHLFINGCAAVVKNRLVRGWDGSAVLAKPWFHWMRWPEVVNTFRTVAARPGGMDDVEEDVRRLSEIPVLVLDDLGAERVKPGGYEQDWAASQLDLLVDRRYGNMAPTFYTCNLNSMALVERYGARFYSRLCGENPMVVVERGPDLRMVKG